MIKKSFFILTTAVAMFFASCAKYDHAIGDLQDRLDKTDDFVLPTINQQIDGINTSIDDLESVDAELNNLIENLEVEAADLQQQLDGNATADAATKEALEKEIADVNNLIEALQAKDAELDQQIAALSEYVDDELTAVEDWANATFATLTQYGDMQTEIAELATLIEQCRTELTVAYTKAIEEAIAASETSMKAWVSETLAEGYYDIAAIDAKLAALEGKLTDADADLAKQLSAQEAALEQAKKDLTGAYEKAITEAIETNNGIVNAAIAEAVQDALSKVDAKLAVIDNTIAAIQKDIEDIKSDIADIEQQITAINGSLEDLKVVDAELKALIDALQAEATDLQSQLDANAAADATTKKELQDDIAAFNALIVALQAKDADLDQQIAALQTYVDSEIAATEDKANATFATLTQYAEVQSEVAAINALIETYKNEFTEAYAEAVVQATQAVKGAIAESEASMKLWVNETLAEGYYDISTVDAKLAALESKLNDADANLAERIAAQQTALEQAKADLAATYEKAIKDAIETNNGEMSKQIADAVKAAQDALKSQIDAISAEVEAIKADVALIKDAIASINIQIENIGASIDDLEAVDAALQTLITNLEAKASDLQSQLDANAAADAATKKELKDEIAVFNALIAALQVKDADLEQQIAALQTYVDSEITATEDWADATFATLTQYADMQAEVAAINALIETYKNEFTEAYAEAVEQATQAVKDAIAASEARMQSWVNEALANGYYDIAEMDGLLDALESKLSDSDEELADELAAQKAALEQAKSDLTAAYKTAIEQAIDDNNGYIAEQISDAVKAAQDALQSQIDAINVEVAAIQADIVLIKDAIASINTQIENIGASIDDLEAVDAALQTLINNLTSKAADLQSQLEANAAADTETKKALQAEITSINTLIAALQAKDVELDQQIADLKAYVDGEIGSTEDWVSGTFATLEQYAAMQTEIATLRTLIETYKTDITAAYTEAIENAIAASENSMKAWVNELLADGYYDIAEIDAKLATLENKLADADADLAKQIENQQEALEQAKTDLTTAYEAAIEQAIEEYNGIITQPITEAIDAALGEVETRLTTIEGKVDNLQDDLEELQSNFAKRIQSLIFLPKYSDGKVKMDYGTKSVELDFLVSPRKLTRYIQLEHLSAYVRLTDDPSTRAAATEYSLDVVGMSVDTSTGEFSVKVKDLNATLGANFWEGTKDAIIYVRISDGNNDVVSCAIPMVAN